MSTADARRAANIFGVTNIASTSFNVVAGTNASVTLNVTIHDPYIQSENRTGDNIKPWESVFILPHMDIRVDTDDDLHAWAVGASLTDAQKNMRMNTHNRITPNAGKSHLFIIQFYNDDASDHTLYLDIGAKYIILQ